MQFHAATLLVACCLLSVAAAADASGAINSTACREKGFTGIPARGPSLCHPALQLTLYLQKTFRARRAPS
jgi:hypothetical protein